MGRGPAQRARTGALQAGGTHCRAHHFSCPRELGEPMVGHSEQGGWRHGPRPKPFHPEGHRICWKLGVMSMCNMLSLNACSLSVGTKSLYIVLTPAQSWSPINERTMKEQQQCALHRRTLCWVEIYTEWEKTVDLKAGVNGDRATLLTLSITQRHARGA